MVVLVVTVPRQPSHFYTSIMQVLYLCKIQAACIDEPFDCDTNIEAKATNGTFFDLHYGIVCTEGKKI